MTGRDSYVCQEEDVRGFGLSHQFVPARAAGLESPFQPLVLSAGPGWLEGKEEDSHGLRTVVS